MEKLFMGYVYYLIAINALVAGAIVIGAGLFLSRQK